MSRTFLLEDHSWFRRVLADLLEPDLEVVGEARSLAEARDAVPDKQKRSTWR